jgi:ubiquinone/menaquinone biosynthesis C-methylase UbiE
MSDDSAPLDAHYCTALAAAFVRGRLPGAPAAPDEDLVRLGLQAGLRLHKFKRTAGLPRVRKVLGILRGLAPQSLLDVGSGRGVFLWPLLEAFPHLAVTALDRSERRVADIDAVSSGGLSRLRAVHGDATRLPLGNDAVDGVTILEVLEHLEQPARAAAEAVRVARSFVIASVPSRPDDNPEHIHLFSRAALEDLFRTAGARRVVCEAVLNHFVALARV